MHLRHQNSESLDNPELDTPFDTTAMNALSHIRGMHEGSNCSIYLASDRNETLNRIEKHAISIGCSCYAACREYTTKAIVQDDNLEHGPWSRGLIQFADILLLSHGDYFIGTSASSYSLLIADLLAAHVFHKNGVYNPMLWLGGGGYSPLFSGGTQSCNQGRLAGTR
jgi:hypothetical protein